MQQQSTNVLTVAFDDGVSSTTTQVLLNPASGQAGGMIDMLGMPHYGRIRIYGTSGSSVGASDW